MDAAGFLSASSPFVCFSSSANSSMKSSIGSFRVVAGLSRVTTAGGMLSSVLTSVTVEASVEAVSEATSVSLSVGGAYN